MKILDLADLNISMEESRDDRLEEYRFLIVTATLHSQKIGHMKVAWMDPKTVAKKYNNWFAVARNKGNTIPIWPGKPKNWSDDQKREILKQLKLYGFVNPKQYETLDQALRAAEKAIKHKYQESWQKTLDFLVDKPFVEDTQVNPEYQRKGVARAMYVKANEYLKTKYGLNLWGSELQTDSARMLWQNLQQAGLATQENNRWRMI